MTIVIGKVLELSRVEGDNLVRERGLVMAADTEETAPDFKRRVPKLEEFENPSGKLVIGGAGAQPQIDTITSLLDEDFQSWDRKDIQKLEQAFRATIREHYKKHVLSWPTMAEREENDFSLLIGLGLPALDDVRLLVSQKGMLRRAKTHAAIGTGANYANDLLDEYFSYIGESIWVAALLAVYVIYRVKRNIPYCGKDTQVWHMVDSQRWVPPYLIEKAEAIFERFDSFLSGQLFLGVKAGGEKDYEPGFDNENVLGIFSGLRDEIKALVAEMESS